MSRWRDPWWRAIYVLALLVLAGFVTLAFAAYRAFQARYAPLQTPWIVSGGLGALAVIGFAAGAWSIHLSRRDDAEDREAWEDFVATTTALAERIRTGDLTLPGRRSPSRQRRTARQPRASG